MKALTPPVILECTLVMPDGARSPSGFDSRQVELTVECGPAATGKNLAAALGRRYGPGPYTVAGEPLDTLSPGREPLVTGCVILAPSLLGVQGGPDPDSTEAHLDLVVLSGPDSGAALALRRGDHHLGRGASSLRLTDPGLSRNHAVLSVASDAIRWTDRGSLHGTTLNGAEVRGTSDLSTDAVLRCGATAFAIRPTALWVVDLSALGEPPGPPLEIPGPPQRPDRLATVLLSVGPLLGGVALAWSSGSWQFVLLSLLSSAPFLSPAIAGNGAARSFRAQLSRAITTDRDRRELAFPPLGTLLLARAASTSPPVSPSPTGAGRDRAPGIDRSGTTSGTGLLRRDAPDGGLWLRLGTGEVVANVECSPGSPLASRVSRRHCSPAGRRSEARRNGEWADPGPSRDSEGGAPSSELPTAARRGWLGRIRTRRLRPARLPPELLTFRRAVRPDGTFTGSSPLVHPDAPVIIRADPGLVVEAAPSDYVEFVCGLIVQLVRRPDGRRPGIVLVDPRKVLPSSLRFLPGVRWAKDWTGLLPDGEEATDMPGVVAVGAPGLPFPSHSGRQPVSKVRTLVLHESPGRGDSALPGPPGFTVTKVQRAVGTITSVHGEPGPATRPGATPGSPRNFIPDFIPLDVLDRFCRGFRNLDTVDETPQAPQGHRVLPRRIGLAALAPTTSPGILDAWRSSSGTGSFLFPLGATEEGLAVLDLVQDGPHFLVAGTTGSGKSELLRTLILSAVSHLPPSEVGFILVDFKGGAAFDGLGHLPHVHGLVTDLGPSELDRALASLRAEITHRERWFRELGVPDWAGYRNLRRPDDAALPRVCLIIDEFRMMMDHAPDSLRELVRLASIGRSLGIHLILATQRPQGAVSADIRANLGTSIALRLQSDLDSLDVVGTSEAAGIAPDIPGRAVLAKGAARTLIQIADASWAPALGDEEVRVTDWHGTATNPEETLEPKTLGAAGSRLAEPDDSRVAAWCAEVSSAWEAWTGGPERNADRSTLGQPSETPEPGDREGLHGRYHGGSGHHREPSHHQASPPRRVLAPALPHSFDPAAFQDLPSSPSDGLPSLALVDLPELQRQVVLRWSRGESVALLGDSQERSALAAHLLDGVLGEPSRRLTSITGNPARARSHQIVSTRDTDRIAQLIRDVRDRPIEPGWEDVVHIESWESTLAAIRRSEHYGLEAELLELFRDGGNSGIRYLLGGNEGLTSSRVVGALNHALYLPSARVEDDLRLSRKLAALDPSSSRVLVRSSRLGTGLHLAQPVSGPRSGSPGPETTTCAADDS